MARKSTFPKARVPNSYALKGRAGGYKRRTYENLTGQSIVLRWLLSVVPIYVAYVALGRPGLIMAILPIASAILLLRMRVRLVFDAASRTVIWERRIPFRPQKRQFGYADARVRIHRTVLLAPDDDLHRALSIFLDDWHGYTLVVHLAGSPVILARNKKRERVVKMADELLESTGIPWSWADEVMYERRVR